MCTVAQKTLKVTHSMEQEKKAFQNDGDQTDLVNLLFISNSHAINPVCFWFIFIDL